jgi:phosphoglucosamine mutase
VTQQDELEKRITKAKPVDWKKFTDFTSVEVIPHHLDAIVQACEVTQSFNVVIDGALGVGSLVTPSALQQLHASVKPLNTPPDGREYAQHCPPSKIQSAAAAEWQHFVHLDGLSEIVTSTNAHVGIAHDGDADRVLAVDDKGRVLAGDILLALVADYYLATRGGKVIATTVSSSSVVDYVAKQHGARVERSRVGDVFVSNLMKEHQAVMGAEPSGPFIFPEVHYCPDGPLAACKILELLEWAGRPLSQLVDDLPSTALLRASVTCPNEKKDEVMKAVESAFEHWKDIEEVTRVDGVRTSFHDSSWVLIRPSGTEPVIRVTIEAFSAQRAKALLKKAKEVLEKITT